MVHDHTHVTADHIAAPRLIRLRGARTHNLRDVDLDIPRDRLVVFTGLSGSGKSSLAFDTIFAEGQRRYVESLSSYARIFLDRVDRPDVDLIEGLSPAVAIDQKSTVSNPRSTVGTVTEIYDHLRLLWARVGVPRCPDCGARLARRTVQDIADELSSLAPRTRLQLLASLADRDEGKLADLFESLSQQGFSRAVVDGVPVRLAEPPRLSETKRHDVAVVVDRLIVGPGFLQRLTDSIETSLLLAHGTLDVVVDHSDGRSETLRFAECSVCPNGHGAAAPEMEPNTFSFNAARGACRTCAGIGSHMKVDAERALGDPELGVGEGILLPWAQLGRGGRVYFERLLGALARDQEFSLTTPWRDLDDGIRNVVLHGIGSDLSVAHRTRFGRDRTYTTRYEGLVPWLERKYTEAESDAQRARYTKFLRAAPCTACQGRRLAPEVLAVTVCGRSIADVSEMDLESAASFLRTLELSPGDASIVEGLLPELLARLQFLLDIGLGYLTLARAAGTLSGGEAQRIRLATQIGAGLSGVIYVLDEPSIGLHQRDNARLISTLESLRDLGNTVLVVEHDEDTIRAADWVVDVGPGAGVAGGQIMHSGPVADLLSNRKSITSDYLSGRRSVPTPAQRRPVDPSRVLRIEGARENNLKDLTVDLPLGLFTAVTGVSGSGKSTLVNDILYNSLANTLNGAQRSPGRHTRVCGAEHLDKVVHVDQSPIGRSPRSNPATYTGVFDKIRMLFAQTTDAKVRGYTPARFSFNVKGGRCEDCLGEGTSTVEMNFLPDVHIQCETCGGRRFNRDTLDIRFKGRSIADVLDMRIAEATEFFGSHRIISRYLTTLDRVGLGYLTLGQSAVTLSGGEAQRIKLATELQRRTRGRSLYILDEPTSGLHFEDVHRVLELLQALVAKGNTVVVIEHNIDVIRCADWVIDLGPEGGRRGGMVVGCGTPDALASMQDSQTGKYIQSALTGRTA